MEAAMVPVKAPLVTADERPPVGAVVAVNGPVAMISLFSGASGSTDGSTELLAAWEQRDPLVVFGRRLIERGEASPDELDAIDRDCAESVSQAIAAALTAPLPDPADLEVGVYA